MFALGLRYLMGWAMAAADGREKIRAEWPPHPDRVFMALAAAWFETGENSAQGAALRWLEALPAPYVAASDAQIRGSDRRVAPVVSYVPVNDSKLGKKVSSTVSLGKLKDAGLDILPEYRSRQPRSFPVAIPELSDVFLIWQEIDASAHLDALRTLADSVTHVGHSASLVQMWVESVPPEAVWHPSEKTAAAAQRMRVSYQGRLDYLRNRMNRDSCIAYRDLAATIKRNESDKKMMTDKVEKKAATAKLKALKSEFAQFNGIEPVTFRPEDARWQGYARADALLNDETPSSLFDPQLLVIAVRGRHYPLVSALRMTGALRGALLNSCPEPIPEWLSGHVPANNEPTRKPHLAMLPLPFVGSDHADGHVMGLAFALPRELNPEDTARCLNPLLWDMQTGAPRTFKLFDGQWLEATAEVELRGAPPHNLRSETWTRAAKVWASVTPVVLDRHFKGATKWNQSAESLKTACERIGLPRPELVLLNSVSSVEGVPPAHRFPALRRKRYGGSMEHIHATFVFAEPVTGPVLLGAGRFRGYGFCRPMDGETGHA
jgi:CRISPR-associated protein Csb2